MGHGCSGGVGGSLCVLKCFPFLFFLKTIPFNLSLSFGFGERFIEDIFSVGGVAFHVQVPGGATFVGAVRVPGG